MKNINSDDYSHINKEFLKKSIKIINEHKTEFEDFLRDNQKLQAVKALRDYITDAGLNEYYFASFGLKECKDVIDLYFLGNLPSNIREERKEKLERLAKIPLTNEIIFKFKNLEEDELRSLLLNLSLDDLLLIDNIFPEKE